MQFSAVISGEYIIRTTPSEKNPALATGFNYSIMFFYCSVSYKN